MIGKTLGHYQITEKVGEGGMGVVYKARDARLDRFVALKVLPPEMQQDPSAHERFMREATSAAALDHPYICHINEVGEAEGKDFIVMEYVEGQTLKARLGRGPLPLKETRQIATEVLEALEKAHEKGIIHRDLKPSNIMLTVEGHAKVMDFGLAKQLKPASASENQEETLSALTQSDTIPGTLAYMSPEQLQGRPVDARSDIFSFGIVLYEMLTGVHPFRRPSAVETAIAILTETAQQLDRYTPAIPSRLQDIAGKLLVKDPLLRFKSAHEVHVALSSIFTEGQAISAVQRRFPRIGLAVALIVLFFGIFPVSWWVRERYFESPQTALGFQERDWILIADVENLTGDPVFDRSLQTAMTIGIQQSKYVNVFPTVRVQEALQRMRKERGAKLDETLACEIAVREGVNAVLACSIGNVGGVYSLTARLVEPNRRATVMSQTAKAPAKSDVLSVLDSLVDRIRRNLGESLASLNQSLPLPEATTASLEALKTYADGIRIMASDKEAGFALIQQAAAIDPDFALAHAELGVACYRFDIKGGRVKGEEHFTKALSLMNRLTLRERLWIRAVIEDERGKGDEAIKCYRAFLAQYPDDKEGWSRVGWVHMVRLEQHEKAIEAFNRVLQIDPSNSAAYINIATCYAGAQDEDARKNYEKGFDLDQSAITGRFINGEYGFTLVRLGEIEKAAATFQKMIASEEVLKRARGYRSMAFLLMYQGKLSDAIATFKRAISINRAEQAWDSEFRDHLFLASAYRLKGQIVDLKSELAAANQIVSQHSFEPGFIAELAATYARIGKTREASRLLYNLSAQAKNLTATSMIGRTNRGDQAYISHVKGELALADGRVAEAIECFDLACQLKDRASLESLALASRRLGKLQKAAEKYKDVIAYFLLYRGEMMDKWILAHYELARIYTDLGDSQQAKEYYEKLLDIWNDADPDIPILKQAKAEYARLQ